MPVKPETPDAKSRTEEIELGPSEAAQDTVTGSSVDSGESESKPPDGGYGWVIVGCVFALNSVTWGVNTVYGVYSSYYLANNYYDGGSPIRYAWVGGSCAAIALACGPIANLLTRAFGFRVPLILGALCTVLGQIAAGLSHNFGSFLATQGVLFGLGLGLTLVPAQPLLAQWFDHRLGRAQGLANAGSGLGALVLSNTTRLALETIGVKWSLIVNGLVSLCVLVPSIVLLRSREPPRSAHLVALHKELIWHPGFVWVWLWGTLAMMGYFISLYSLASFATHGLSLSQKQGAALQSILAAGQMVGRPIWGMLLDHGGRINMAILCYILAGASCLTIWLPARSFAVLAVFAAVQGLCGGTVWSAGPPVTASVLPSKSYANGLAIFWLACVPSALVGQPIAIALINYSANRLDRGGADAYSISIGFCGGLGMVSAILLLGAKRNLQQNWAIWTKV